MASAVLDASALLALLLGEEGADAVHPFLKGGCISVITYSEILARTAAICGSLEEAKRRVDRQGLSIVLFDADQAALVASVGPATQALGLSFSARASLALGLAKEATVVTADRTWKSLDIGVRVECIR